ncbi:hypothetical protein E2562_028742 [Oryza meyeriana var. granulata]|uniref:Uncharacterized protein n=1 Tax=Oryza meyeriana var. granulata TaxID=110450 RepID=A0A6G1D8U2_9ORYZ|nr:hypothetical protein E2562_028742 [Oryza meyeriana var. granulata]
MAFTQRKTGCKQKTGRSQGGTVALDDGIVIGRARPGPFFPESSAGPGVGKQHAEVVARWCGGVRASKICSFPHVEESSREGRWALTKEK